MTQLVAYNNIFDIGTVTATSSDADFPLANGYDWLHDTWKAGAAGTVYVTIDCGANTNVDYWAIGLNDLHLNSGTIKPQYSTDNFAADINDLDTIQTPVTPTREITGVIFRKVTDPNVRYYRLEISSASVASAITMMAMGTVLELPKSVPVPWKSPRHGRNNKILNSHSDTGNTLGSSKISNGSKFTIYQNNVPVAWIDSNWDAWADHMEENSFFYSWDYENRPLEAVMARAISIKDPEYTNSNILALSIECRSK